jgi:hypothetical protein
MTHHDCKDRAICRRNARRVAPVATLGMTFGAALAAFILATAPTARADVVGDGASLIGAVDADPFGDVFGDNTFTNSLDSFLGPQFGAVADKFVNALGLDDPAVKAAAAGLTVVDRDPFGDVFGSNSFTDKLDASLPAQFATGADQFVNALGFDDPARLAAAADPASLMRLDNDPFGDVFGTNAFTTALDGLLPAQFAVGADQFVDLFTPAAMAF